jgi:hypothetical protein
MCACALPSELHELVCACAHVGILRRYELMRIAESLQSAEYSHGQEIIREGEEGDRFYIVEKVSQLSLRCAALRCAALHCSASHVVAAQSLPHCGALSE